MLNDPLVSQLEKIKHELDEMIKLMLDKGNHVDVAGAIFAASAQVCKAEILLKMKGLTEQQLKELGIKNPIE